MGARNERNHEKEEERRINGKGGRLKENKKTIKQVDASRIDA